ncbi:hypothetical protein [Streptomyces sp. NBC_01618]|uniref:hypothetical protein n=1 Tax=Streptomyces sp. NBC_01618 TaxID=2975900 RepID=UPI00386DB00F|nr:hypothetical protein OH735_25735 [Streptomyces sp. NBC_01618]
MTRSPAAPGGTPALEALAKAVPRDREVTGRPPDPEDLTVLCGGLVTVIKV